jgi:soluble lytic murein transglycosylase
MRVMKKEKICHQPSAVSYQLKAKDFLATLCPALLAGWRFKYLLLYLLILLASCNLAEQPNVIYVTATPEAERATPASSPTPTVPPTPTTPPEVNLQIADRYLVNGYFEDAINTYRTVLEQGASPELTAEAALGLGRAALREGYFTDAVDALTTFINQYPQDSRVAQVHFLRGDAYLGLSRWADAIADFKQYLALRPGLIDSYANERIGDAQLALDQFDEALLSYNQAVDATRSTVPLLALREKVAQLHISAGQPTEAVAQYDAILAVAQNAPYRASIEFAAAQVLLDSGDSETGLARMQGVFDEYVGTTAAYQAMNVLLANDVELDDYARGQVSYLYGDYEGAIEALNAYSTQRILSEIPPELHLMLGRAYREIGNPTAALTAFETVIDQYPQSPAFGEALLEQGRTKFLSGDIPGAIEQYLYIADNFDYLPEAAEALWRAGYLYGTNDQPELSRTIFERLSEFYPDTEQAKDGLFLAASAAYNAGDLADTERLFARLATTTTGDDQAAAYLWVGRLAQQRGDAQTSSSALALAIQASPDSYFSARAHDMSSGEQPFATPVNYKFEFDDAIQLQEAEDWLRQIFNITQEGALWPLSAALEADPRLIRGRELWAVAAYEEAEVEFDDVLASTQSDALASYQLGIFFRGIAAYSSSIQAAANVIRTANVGTLDAPPYIARMRYPVYYLDVIQAVAQQRGINPLLMFSLIRHESLFDTYATAAAGEKGLTQVIPSTGEYIAGELQWPDYQHSDLFRPYAGIAFGAFYLWEQLDLFDNNVIAALAGYNAGPGRAAGWLELSGGDPDLFMTTITIDSTRLYVQRIYGYYNIYRALYSTS